MGTVVSVHEGTAEQPPGYTLKFFSLTGETLTGGERRSRGGEGGGGTEILHARSLSV